MAEVATPAAKPVFRDDLQGLRAVAIGLVVLYHVWFGRVSGGIDVFFVLSGFFVTGSLLRTYEREGSVKAGDFIGRVATRLWPAAMVVLTVTLLATWLWLPAIRWESTTTEIIASILYVENWQLIAQSVDYLSINHGPSPVQHFWSMSIQGQIYLVWPLLVLGLALVAKPKAGAGIRKRVGIAMVLVFAASFAYSVWLTAENQPVAYFSTFTRIWEFALGGLLAAGITLAARMPDRYRLATGWIGLVGIVVCGIVITGARVFPGYAALWPTLAAVAVIVAGTHVVAGTAADRYGAGRMLSSRAFKPLGDIAYPLYLWHWPILVFYLLWADQARAGFLGGLAVIVLSLVLAAATHLLVERPMMEKRKNRMGPGRAVALASMLIVPLAVAFAWNADLKSDGKIEPIPPELASEYPGALALEEGVEYTPVTSVEDLIPEPIYAANDLPPVAFDGCLVGVDEVPDDPGCEYGDPNSSTVIAVAGSSMVAQWTAALIPIAEEQGWRLVVYVKGACQLSADMATRGDRPNPSCDEWNEKVVDDIIELQPDLAFVAATRIVPQGRLEYEIPGARAIWDELAAGGVPMVGMRAHPFLRRDAAECVSEFGLESSKCAIRRDRIFQDVNPTENLDIPGWSTIDLTDGICEPKWCRSVVGNVLAYRDKRHLSGTMVRSLIPALEQRLLRILKDNGERSGLEGSSPP